MSRIKACFEALKEADKKALIPYLVAGDSDPSVTVDFMHQLVTAGADVIELGVPFSDPMAEGPVIQRAHERALEHNVSLTDTLAMVKKFRETNASTPVVLMGYANPVEVMGYDVFAERASEAGVDGLLTVDMPPEEATELGKALAKFELDAIYLIAPTTTQERSKTICDNATGYIYYVSLKGVTGAAHLDTVAVEERMAELRAQTDLPLCVGFGISTPETAATVSKVADGVVVGSALVKQFDEADAVVAANTAAELLGAMRTAMNND